MPNGKNIFTTNLYKIVTLVVIDPAGPVGPVKFTTNSASAAETGSPLVGVDKAKLEVNALELLIGILNGKNCILI